MMEEGKKTAAATVESQFITQQQQVKPARGGVILALGILGILCCFICGIIAWVLGNNDLKEMAMGMRDVSGRGLTHAGKVCGIVGIVLQIIVFALWLLGVGFLFVSRSSAVQ